MVTAPPAQRWNGPYDGAQVPYNSSWFYRTLGNFTPLEELDMWLVFLIHSQLISYPSNNDQWLPQESHRFPSELEDFRLIFKVNSRNSKAFSDPSEYTPNMWPGPCLPASDNWIFSSWYGYAEQVAVYRPYKKIAVTRDRHVHVFDIDTHFP